MVFAHPIKMSTGKLEIDTEKKLCTITINLFIDDFETAIRKLYPQPPFNFTAQPEIMQNSIADYVMLNISISDNSEPISLKKKSITKQKSNVCQIIMTGSLNNLVQQSKIVVVNSLLFSSYNKQTNILYVYINGEQTELLKFYPSNAKKSIELR